MGNKVPSVFIAFLGFMLLALLSFDGTMQVSAQGPQPNPSGSTAPSPSPKSTSPRRLPSGLYASTARPQSPPVRAAQAPRAVSGPDYFGYYASDTVSFSWIDASTGFDSGLSGDDAFTGPINIGFNFPFYQNVYSQLYFSTNALITFGQGSWAYAYQSIPNPLIPNNFIAPMWQDMAVGGAYNPGKVYYLRGGTAPNRYFVVEWYNVTSFTDTGTTNYKTFEAILYENGNITIQYLSLLGNLYSTTGIENNNGTIGLQYQYNNPGLLTNGKAVSFYRPTTGGPDNFGYIWSSGAIAWPSIDATSGTNTGLGGSVQSVGPVPLPFVFKYYENSYSQIYISKFGFAGFTNTAMGRSQGHVPDPATPNNIIAPYWAPLLVNESGYTGQVYYASRGSAPNRYFVVEWFHARGSYDPANSDYTFVLILYENGDIEFQYGSMINSSTYYCGTAGIEDSTGTDGLTTLGFCSQAISGQTVRFFRPPPTARVFASPLAQGNFTRAGSLISFQIVIRNTGDLGTDTFDILASATWPVYLYAADGITPLVDTNLNGIPDTGPVAMGNTFTIIVKVQTALTANVGDANTAQVLIRSSLNPNVQKTAILNSAIPSSFAQVYRDSADGAMSVYLVQPQLQYTRKASSDFYYGNEPAVAALQSGGLVYIWDKGRCVNSQCSVYTDEVEYSLLDRNGTLQKAPTRLLDNSTATLDTFDYLQTVAVAPNGQIGIVWLHELYDQNTNSYNDNIYFAILSPSGTVSYGPISLTGNTGWWNGSNLNVPYLYSPVIAGTDDNRFVLAWRDERLGPPTGSCSSSCYVEDIWYSVRDTNGGVVRAVTKFTNDLPGPDDGYYDPAVDRLAGNRVLLTFVRYGWSNPRDLQYTVLDSTGNIVKAPTYLTNDGWITFESNPSGSQLSNGRFAVAWSDWDVNGHHIAFAILDSAYNRVAGPTILNNPSATTGDDFVSVTADSAGRAILTWMDYRSNRNLYYALVDSNGNVLTQPMIFRTGQASSPYIESSDSGYGSAPLGPAPSLSQFYLPFIMKNPPPTPPPPGGLVLGNWGGAIVTFWVSSGPQWMNFHIDFSFGDKECRGSKRVNIPGPGNITNNDFGESYSSIDGIWTFTGHFSSPSSAEGSFTFDGDAPPCGVKQLRGDWIAQPVP